MISHLEINPPSNLQPFYSRPLDRVLPNLYQRQIRILTIDQPLVSVILVARNEDEWLRKTLESLYQTKNQTAYEVIVYDDYSDDDCGTDLAVHQFMRSSHGPIGPSRARNHGAMNARGDILIFCDSHLKFQDDWIDLLVQPILDDLTDAVNPIISDIAIPTTKGHGWRFDLKTYEYKWAETCTEFKRCDGVAGGCFAIKKSVFLEVGMFDKAFLKWGLEDSELNLRLGLAGYRCAVEPRVDVGHFFKEKNDYGVDWQSYTYNFIRMLYVNLNTSEFGQGYELISGDADQKKKVLDLVVSTSKYRKRFCEALRRKSLQEYLANVVI